MTYPKPSHGMRVPDDSMSPRYRAGHWLCLIRCRRPAKGRDVVFVDQGGAVIVGEVLGVSATGWRIGQFHGEPRYAIRRLSAARWRSAWRVVSIYMTDESAPLYEALALGLTERAAAIVRAYRRLGPMPSPLPEAQQRALPRVVRMPRR